MQTLEYSSQVRERFEKPDNAGRLLGRWRLRSNLGGDTWLRVEEYKRPTFEVEIAEPK